MRELLTLSPYQLLLDKAQKGQIDPEDVDINELIEEFKQQVERLSSVELFFQAGSFLQAMASLLKLKADKLLGVSPKEEKRKPKIKLEEVIKAIEQEQDQEDILDSLWDYYDKEVRGGAKVPKELFQNPQALLEYLCRIIT